PALQGFEGFREELLCLRCPAVGDQDLGDPGEEEGRVQLLLVDVADRREPLERLLDAGLGLAATRRENRAGQAEKEAAVRLEELETLLAAMVVEALGVAARRGVLPPEVMEERQQQIGDRQAGRMAELADEGEGLVATLEP